VRWREESLPKASDMASLWDDFYRSLGSTVSFIPKNTPIIKALANSHIRNHPLHLSKIVSVSLNTDDTFSSTGNNGSEQCDIGEWNRGSICYGCDLNTINRCDMHGWLLFGQIRGVTNCKKVPHACDLISDGRCDVRDLLIFGQDWGRTNYPMR